MKRNQLQRNKLIFLTKITLMLLILNSISAAEIYDDDSALLIITHSVSALEICDNGLDDDGDSLTDSLIFLNPDNQERNIIGTSFNSLYLFAKSKDSTLGSCPLSGHGNALLLSNNAPWTTGTCSQISLQNLDPTVTRVCNLASYKTPYSWDSMYSGDGGRCNWYSPGDDCMWHWNGVTFDYMNGLPKYNKRWLTQLECITKVSQCSNLLDDDNDGKIDMADSGCASQDDDSEKQNDPDCDTKCYLNSQCSESYCEAYSEPICKNGDSYKSRICHEKGCSSATGSCFDTTRREETLVEDCAYGCESGKCAGECSSDIDCDDDNIYTKDKCNNPGMANSLCSHETIACTNNNDCGTTGFFGIEFCSNDDVFKFYKTSICVKAGTTESYCNVTDKPTFIIDCGEKTCEQSGTNYCKYNDVYKLDSCNKKGCETGFCYSRFDFEETLVESCQYGCNDGSCLFECSKNSDCDSNEICYNNHCIVTSCKKNSDCGTEGYRGNKFCSNNDSYQNYENFLCSNPNTNQSSCSSTITAELRQDCTSNQVCSDGACKNIVCHQNLDCNDSNPMTEDKCINPGNADSNCAHNLITCFNNSDCGQDKFLNEPFCSNGNLFDRFITNTCHHPGIGESHCMNMTEFKLTASCSFGCQNSSCINYTECEADSDCNDDYFSERYCNSGDAYVDKHDFSCFESKCKENVVKKLSAECSHGCASGKCTSGGGSYYNDDDDSGPLVFSPQEREGRVYFNNTPINESLIKIVKNKNSDEISLRAYLWALLLIILIILIIILITVFLLRN